MPCHRLLLNFLIAFISILPAFAQVTEPVELDSYAQVLYVSVKTGSDVTGTGTQTSPYQSINRALQDASDASEAAVHAILVASGTYTGSQSTIVILTPWIHLYGGFSPTTWERNIVVYPTRLNGENKRIAIYGASHTWVDGFTITQCSSNGSGHGAVNCWRINSATLSNCIIIDNSSAVRGLFLDGASLNVKNCSFVGNRGAPGAAIYCLATATLKLDSCTLVDNNSSRPPENPRSFGGAIHLDYSSAEITGCTINQNRAGSGGGGIDVYASTAIITGCTISGNTSAYSNGGGLQCSNTSSCVLTNCVIADNSCSGKGGAIHSEKSELTLHNCTVAGNIGVTKVGGISSTNSSVSITNSILWNYAEEIVYETVTPFIRYSCLQGGFAGEGNIDAYPHFISSSEGDYHLLDGSPCIDSASASVPLFDDIAGRLRPGADGKVDMGAYESSDEYEGGAFTVPMRYYVRANASPGATGLSWEEAFPAIIDAIWLASYHTEIWVASGTYMGTIQQEPGLALYGGFAGTETTIGERNISSNQTIINGAGTNESTVTGSENSVLDGFILTGGECSTGGGLFFSGVTSATVANCTIQGNSAGSDSLGGGGLYCTLASPYLRSCSFSNNIAANVGGAIYLANSSPVFEGCSIQGNTALAGGALACENSSPTFTNCMMNENTAYITGSGLYCDDSTSSLIHCTIAGNHYGLYSATGITCTNSHLKLQNSILWNSGPEIQLDSSTAQVTYSNIQGGWPGKGNINVYPAFVDVTGGNWRLAEGSPCIDSGTIALDVTTDSSGNPRPGGDGKVDMGAYESIDDLTPTAGFSPPRLYVNSSSAVGGDGLSWGQSLPTLCEALWLTGGDSEIWLASGDYNEPVWLEPGVSVYGGLAGSEDTLPASRGTSTIDASLFSPHRPVTAAEGIILDHLRITGALYSYEGALYFDQVDSATVNDCVIEGNATEYCGGVLCANSSPMLINCNISNNWTALGGGGLHCDPLSSPRLVGCTISGNHTEFDGGGVYCYIASPVIQQCTISGNSSASYGGGILLDSSEPLLENCFITGNTSVRGAAISSNFSQPVFTNCTIAGNVAGASWETLLIGESSAMFTNCIFWANSPTIIDSTGIDLIPRADYCDIEGGWSGSGGHNISLDPLFAGNGDFHLQAASPCINSGTGPASSPLVPLTDIDGDPRSGQTCDMGADEFVGPTRVLEWVNY